jgi:hypothetical protein
MLHMMNIIDVVCYILASFKFGVWNPWGWHRCAKTHRSGGRLWMCFVIQGLTQEQWDWSLNFGTSRGRDKMNRLYLTTKYALTAWQVSSVLLYLIAVDECFSTYVLLVGKCLIQIVSNKFNIRFLIKIRKNMMWTLQLLTEAYCEVCVSHSRVLEWHSWFLEGREIVKVMIG